MYERRAQTPEDKIDSLLARGDLNAAEFFIDEYLRWSGLDGRSKELYHVAVKRAALPLFELARGTDDPRAYDEANDAYAHVGELLARAADHFSEESPHNIGEISELTFLALHLGEAIDETTRAVILPATRQRDKKGTDFYFSPVGTGKIDDGFPVQIKTVGTEEDKDRYGHATLVHMTDLDPHARDPVHPNSLASTILRVLEGESANDDDFQRLDDARRKTYDLILNKQRTSRGRAGALFQAAKQLLYHETEATA